MNLLKLLFRRKNRHTKDAPAVKKEKVVLPIFNEVSNKKRKGDPWLRATGAEKKED